jgi:alpha-tubulin suppressor-like RCC1 family protein
MSQFPSNIRFPIRDANGAATTTVVDMADMFVKKELFLTAGLWAWGVNSDGRLGDSTTTNKSSPVQIGSLTTWRQVSPSQLYGAAVKVDGTLWTWGANTYGSLGDGTTTNKSSPIQVGALTNWKSVSAGYYMAFAIKTDGTLWTWGNDQPGYGTGGVNVPAANYSSPVQVGALTDWRSISIGPDSYFAAAIKTDGTLWTWGSNFSGQIGDNSTTNRSIPVQVGSLTDWQQISSNFGSVLAVKKDGTLWAWGSNSSGQLGLNDLTPRSSPVQVGTLTNWRQVALGSSHAMAVKKDGTLWSWGSNTAGQLGQNDLTPRSSPVQVGTLSDWKTISCGNSQTTYAIKTNGSFWAWGTGAFGVLPFNDSTDRSSPVQVGALTTWKQVAQSSNFSLAIQSPDLP